MPTTRLHWQTCVIGLKVKTCYIAVYCVILVAGGPATSGQKPGESSAGRRGGRSDKTSGNKEAIAQANEGYVVVRKSGRIQRCLGCRNDFSLQDQYVIQHTCAMPYPSRTTEGQLVMISPRRQTNHYFHLTKECILKQDKHKDFDLQVIISPSILNFGLRKNLLDRGFKVE